MRGFKEFKTNPNNERLKIDECWPLGAAFTITAESFYNILRDAHVGTRIYFRGQANEVVAESRTNRLDPQIRKTGLWKRVYHCPRQNDINAHLRPLNPFHHDIFERWLFSNWIMSDIIGVNSMYKLELCWFTCKVSIFASMAVIV